MRGHLLFLELHALLTAVIAVQLNFNELAKRHTFWTDSGVHLPIVSTVSRTSPKRKRRALQGVAGLGDYMDVVYNVLVTVGETAMPVVLDTGSSDLWVASESCSCVDNTLPAYPRGTFNPSGLDIKLVYGDATSRTFASGPIGTDTVTVAGFTLSKQYFAAVNASNTSIVDTDSTGILGLGFPLNSFIFYDVIGDQLAKPSKEPRDTTRSERQDYHGPTFPSLLAELGIGGTIQSPSAVQQILASFSAFAPVVSRLVAATSLSAPMFSVALQRDTIEIGGNIGMLSIGELHPNVKNESLTWVALRAYTSDQGGLPSPPSSPNEVYPLAWEVFLDAVYFDGERLPPSQLSPPNIQLSALIDTGNSILRGPSDLVDLILTRLGQEFPCNEPHNISFSIGGQLFPVDPRDFVGQAFSNDVSRCTANLAPTGAPRIGGFLHSWSLGVPFLKSVVSAYYYGNLSFPSHDPPRIGFLSTVPSDSGELLKAAVNSANQNGQNFPSRVEPAPTGGPASGTLASDGVAQVTGASKKQSSSGLSGPGHPTWTNLLLTILVIGNFLTVW